MQEQMEPLGWQGRVGSAAEGELAQQVVAAARGLENGGAPFIYPTRRVATQCACLLGEGVVMLLLSLNERTNSGQTS